MVMPSLGLIVGRNGFLTVQPPVVFGVVVRGLDLQNSGGAVRQFYKVIHIRQHPGILRVLEHLFDLIDLVAGPVLEDLRHQRFQQVSHLQGHPVVLMVLDHGNVQLVIKQIPGCPPRRNAQQSRNIAATNTFPAVSKPLFFGQSCRIHQHQGLMPLFDSRTACRHIQHPLRVLRGMTGARITGQCFCADWFSF